MGQPHTTIREGKEVTMKPKWNEGKTILLNDVEGPRGAMHVERSIEEGGQMKVEVTHIKSGAKMYRLFDKMQGESKS